MKGSFLKALLGLTMMFVMSLMFSASIAASDSPKDFKMATEMCYLGSDQGVPVQVTLISIVSILNLETITITAQHLHPWINAGNGQAPVMYAELLVDRYDLSVPVQIIRFKYNFCQNYCAPPLTTIDRYSDTQRNSG